MTNSKQKSNLARLVALITGDGHLQISKWRYITSFYSKDINEINKVNNLFKGLFQKEGKIQLEHSLSLGKKGNKRYRLIFISREITDCLYKLGTPSGNKTNVKFLVPNWILNGNKIIKIAYIQSLYDAEGCIYRTKSNNRWRISLEMYKREDLIQNEREFFEQIRNMLLGFNIIASPVRLKKGNIRKDGSKSIGCIMDIEKTSFRNFYKEINFGNNLKREKLKMALKPLPLRG